MSPSLGGSNKELAPICTTPGGGEGPDLESSWACGIWLCIATFGWLFVWLLPGLGLRSGSIVWNAEQWDEGDRRDVESGCCGLRILCWLYEWGKEGEDY